MARQLLYNGTGQSASVNVPSAPRVMGPPQTGYDVGSQLIKALGDAGHAVVNGIVAAHNKKQESMLEDADLDARRQMVQWQAEYMRTHKGVDALEAQQAYEQQWNAIAQGVREKYGSRIGPEFQRKFERRLALQNIYAVADGARYQAQQEQLWNRTVDEGSRAAHEQDIAVHFNDPARLDMINNEHLRRWQARHPGEDIRKEEYRVREATGIAVVQGYLAAGELDKAEEALNRYGGVGSVQIQPGIGNTTAQYESGSDGINAIGYDKNGGTSYGKWQLSSKQGSFGEWLDYLATQGEAGSKAAANIRAAGKANTGSRKGNAVDAYLKEAQANPELFENTQREYIQNKHYGPMLNNLAPEQRKQIENSPALQEMAWSTAVQHGGAGGSRILNRIWKPGMSDADMVKATYLARGGNFGSSTTQVQGVVKERFRNESGLILSMLEGGQNVSSNQPRAFASDKFLTLHRQIETAKRKRAEDATVTKSAFSNQIAMGIDTGNFSDAEASITTMRQFKMDKEAYELEQQLAVAKTFHGLMASVGNLPLAEQAGEAQKLFSQVTNKDNAKYAISMRDHALAAINKRIEAFKKDPAAAVQGNALLQGEMSPQDRVTKTLELQASMGKGITFEPRILPKETADNMRSEYDKLKTGTDRVDYLYGLQMQFGDYTEGVLREMKMPAGISVVLPVVQAIPRKDLGAFITGMTIKSKDEPNVNRDELAAMRDAVGSDFRLLNQIREMRKRFFDNDSIRNLENSMVRGAYYYLKDTGQSGFDTIDGAYSLSSDNNTFLILPKYLGVDAEEVSRHLEFYREGRLQEDLEKGGFLEGTKQGKDSMEYKANLRSFLSNAVFVSTNDGKSAYLIDPKTELPIRKKDGSVYQVSFEKARSAYEGRDTAIQEATEAQDIQE